MQWEAGTAEGNNDGMKEKKVWNLKKPCMLDEFPAARPSSRR